MFSAKFKAFICDHQSTAAGGDFRNYWTTRGLTLYYGSIKTLVKSTGIARLQPRKRN